MSINILREEIINDPLGIGYTAMSDEAVLASLLIKNRSILVPLTGPPLIRVLATNGRLAKLKRASEQWADDTKDVVTSIAMVAMSMIEREGATLDAGNAADVALVNALVSANVLSAEDRTALVDGATQIVSRATELNISHVRLGDIQRIRS